MHITFAKLKNIIKRSFVSYIANHEYYLFDPLNLHYEYGDGEIGYKGSGNDFFNPISGTGGYIDGNGTSYDSILNFFEE